MMQFLAWLGAPVNRWFHRTLYLSGVTWGTIRLSFSPSTWVQPIRDVLARQILFTGVFSFSYVGILGIIVGLSVGLQLQVWLGRLGQSDLLAPVLMTILFHEIGPLITNLIVIGRSGTAMATEMASMRVNREVRLLDGLGLDPMIYLMAPRMIGCAISVFCLAIVFVISSLFFGYLFAMLLGASSISPGRFAGQLLRAIQPMDFLLFLGKTIVPGALTALLCCIEGLSIRGTATEIPQAATRGLTRAVMALFIVSGIFSAVRYI